MTMIRKQFYITQEQDRKLKRLAKRLSTTEAELIRKAIEQVDESDVPEADAAWKRALTFMKERKETLPRTNGGRTWNRDDLYDRIPKYLVEREPADTPE